MNQDALPVPVLEHPYWRVNIRPETYEPQAIGTLAECFDLIDKTKVHLRGWDFPHMSHKQGKKGAGPTWVASWSSSGAYVEYWRFYQSAQFLHLSAVREALDRDWRLKLIEAARWHHSEPPEGTWDDAPGFLSLLNFLYRVTEVFEFAARLSQRGVYAGSVVISVALEGVQGFVLLPDVDRAWSEFCSATVDSLEHTWSIPTAELIADSAAKSVEATEWFFQRLGWLRPNRQVLQKDQAKFLKGLY